MGSDENPVAGDAAAAVSALPVPAHGSAESAPRRARRRATRAGEVVTVAAVPAASAPRSMAHGGRRAPTPGTRRAAGALPTPDAPITAEPAAAAVLADSAEPASVPRRVHHEGAISPENTIFVSLCFEGPDVYSTAGGLGARVTEFTESLAELGYETYLIFVGDPTKPAEEDRVGGKLHLRRWSQWISKYYLNGVYDGEEQKLYDYNETVPAYVYQVIAAPAIAAGKIVVVIGEDWHTAETVCRTSDLLFANNLRHRALLMWNNNSLMSLHRINWGRLAYCATVTTVSRYMKHRLWSYGVNALVIPNGIPHRYLDPIALDEVRALRTVMQRGDPDKVFLFKIGRFDPDKRWLMAVEAVAHLKYSGHAVAMVIRGGIEPHGGEVLSRARHLGLRVVDVDARRPTPAECLPLLRDAGEADIYNLRFYVPEEFVRICNAGADAVLANSGHEPFGLVGLEVMAAGGVAFTGSTGEEYAISFENAVALETDDPDEIVGYLLHLMHHPEEQDKIRRSGKRTAAEFTWQEVIENLIGKLGYLARKQSIALS
ncbi:MAG TPA: glycosyltransferase [Ktedonobacterales bacterium]|nr:glycosyltransferase [Ktedonobacterales bacterium]